MTKLPFSILGLREHFHSQLVVAATGEVLFDYAYPHPDAPKIAAALVPIEAGQGYIPIAVLLTNHVKLVRR